MNKFPNLPFVHLMPFNQVEEKRPVFLITSPPAWKAYVREQLNGLHIAASIEVTQANTAHWDDLQSSIENQKCEAVYAVGGGLVADAAKYIAMNRTLPLVVLPTALSVDAFLTLASGIRRDGCVYYIETKTPETLILDLDFIACAFAGLEGEAAARRAKRFARFQDFLGERQDTVTLLDRMRRYARTIPPEDRELALAAGSVLGHLERTARTRRGDLRAAWEELGEGPGRE